METHPTAAADSVDSTLDVLGHSYRRHAVRVLDEQDCPLTLADLADETAVREFDARLSAIEPDRVRSVYLALYHSHVPQLSEAGVVEYDQKSDVVSPTASVSRLADALDALR